MYEGYDDQFEVPSFEWMQEQERKIKARAEKGRDIREAVIEEYFRTRILALGGIAYKFTSPARRSVPDRVCILPKSVAEDLPVLCGEHIFWVELKRTGQKPTPNQEREHERIRACGGLVLVIDSKELVDAWFPKPLEGRRVSGVPYYVVDDDD